MAVRAATRGGNLSRADWLLRRLAESGERMTGPRETVVRALVAQNGVINPEALSYELHPKGVGRATVYRTLDLLERHGMLTRVHVEGCHGYTLCDEGHHHHLLCTACNRVVPVDASDVEAEIRQLAERLRFRLDTHTLEFSGLCEACQRGAA
ncbi:MAG: transcriptional repressor [Chloroflexi bacterium]|nr:transcriptional repressor [Chloroflexota bacterium]MBV9546548.1 transcriptional repressor [Chloroflexota bacterium]